MKVAVSIPEPVFSEAERLSERLGTSRSDLYTRALRAYVDSRDDDRITEAINAALDGIDPETDELRDFRQEAARQTLKRIEW